MKKNKFINKIIYLTLLISLILGNSIGTAQALFGGGPDVPSIGEIINEVETHYGFDGNILRRAQRKGDYPQIEVFFDKTSPKEGEKVTATAMPKYFKNSNQQLYYTWFLFRDGEDDIEKAKQLAMGIVARGDFDPILFETNYSSGANDPDKDGYEASYGGDNGVGGKKVSSNSSFLDQYEFKYYVQPIAKQVVDTAKITRCYRHNFGFSKPDNNNYPETIYPGEDLIVECEHKFPSNPVISFTDFYGNEINCEENEFEVGDGEFTTKEEACWKLDPNNSDTDGDGFIDEADLAGLGQQQLVWNYQEGDRIGVVIEGTSMVPVNETSKTEQTKLDPLIVFYCGLINDSDNYCVNEDGDVGRCAEQICLTKNICAEATTDNEEPCVASAGNIGTCSFESGVGLCEAVLPCDDPDSSDKDLCQKEGEKIAGICLNSECVLSRCGDSGEKCQTDLGTLGTCNEMGVCIEENVGPGDPSMNPYYKIAWAGLDICDKELIEGDDKRKLIENDECEGIEDYGFTYLATKKINETAENILKPTLISNLSQAQVNTENFKNSDYITIKTVFNENEGVDSDFLDYEWKISIMDEAGNPKVDFSPQEITTTSWVEGDLSKGLGADTIKIRGKAGSSFESLFFTNEKLYYAISLKVNYGGKNQQATLKIPILANNIEIKFLNQAGELICDDDNLTETYGKICPVYPGQLLFGVSDSSGVEGFSWELNNNKLSDKINIYSLPFSGGLYETYSIIPITGSDMSLQTVTLKGKKTNGEEVTSERLISVAKPMAKISSESSTAWPVNVDDGSEEGVISENVFGFSAEEELHFKANLIPNYLEGKQGEYGIELKWYINNQEVDQDFINNNPNNEIEIGTAEDIKFKLLGTQLSSINLTAEVVKKYTDQEKTKLKEAWGITNIKDQTFKKTITLKKNLESSTTGEATVKGNSISVFMASTLKNAPEYFVFIIKTSIVFVLFWSLLYGFEYWFSREIKLKEEND